MNHDEVRSFVIIEALGSDGGLAPMAALPRWAIDARRVSQIMPRTAWTGAEPVALDQVAGGVAPVQIARPGDRVVVVATGDGPLPVLAPQDTGLLTVSPSAIYDLPDELRATLDTPLGVSVVTDAGNTFLVVDLDVLAQVARPPEEAP